MPKASDTAAISSGHKLVRERVFCDMDRIIEQIFLCLPPPTSRRPKPHPHLNANNLQERPIESLGPCWAMPDAGRARTRRTGFQLR
jgi:hypothetical protein